MCSIANPGSTSRTTRSANSRIDTASSLPRLNTWPTAAGQAIKSSTPRTRPGTDLQQAQDHFGRVDIRTDGADGFFQYQPYPNNSGEVIHFVRLGYQLAQPGLVIDAADDHLELGMIANALQVGQRSGG